MSENGKTVLSEKRSRPAKLRAKNLKATGPKGGHIKGQGVEPAIEVFPYGISIGTPQSRPILVLKDKSETDILPVWLHPLDAGLALSDLSQQPSSPHKITRKLLEALKLQIERCEFVDIVGHHQYVKIQFRGPLQVEAIRVRADEAMSFCLAMNARFYSTKTYMLRCREIDEELTRVEHGLRSQPQVTLKNHKYMM